jgi:thiamine biosynthesis lipoprotein ApbE
VIAPTALEADVLSTTLCILGPREGFNLINTLGDGYAALILLRQQKSGKVVLHQTKNFKLLH